MAYYPPPETKLTFEEIINGILCGTVCPDCKKLWRDCQCEDDDEEEE